MREKNEERRDKANAELRALEEDVDKNLCLH